MPLSVVGASCNCKRNFLLAGLAVALISFISLPLNPAIWDISLSYIQRNALPLAVLSLLAGGAFVGACFITHRYRMENSVAWALAFFTLLYLISFRDFYYNLGYALLYKPFGEVALRLISLAFSAPLATALIKNSLRDLKAAGGLLLGIINLSVSCISCTLVPLAGFLAPILSFTAVLPYEGGELALLSALLLLALVVYEGRKQEKKVKDFHL